MNKAVVISITIFLSACVKVGYKPYSQMSGGYKDTSLGNGKYSVEYVAYKSTTEIILPRWHKRASELCLAGYDVLEINKKDDGSPIEISAFISVSRNDAYITGIIQCNN